MLGYDIAQNARSNAQWSTTAGGEYYAVGVHGAITGRRAALAIIDDPVKSQAEADKAPYRDHLWKWYRSDLIPRLKPRACIILIMTRWHEDDLCGRLLEREPNQWNCVKLPALAEQADQLQRTPGEALWPDWEGAANLSRRRSILGDHAWHTQFQQSPKPQTGQLFKIAKLDYVDLPPPPHSGRIVRAWDLAATSESGNAPDWTVGVKLLRQSSGGYFVLDVVRLRGSPRRVEEAIVSTARTDGTQVAIGLPEDPGQAGKSQIAYLAGSLSGYRIISSRESGSKAVRAAPVASQIEAGNFALLRASWNHQFVEELRDFPFGRKDDQVDALSRAFNMILTTRGGPDSVSLSYMDR